MCWSYVVPLYMVNYNWAYINWDSEPVINYMILCDAMQYVTWSWYRLVMTVSTKIGLRLLTFCSSLSTPCCWCVLHNPCACSQLSYQQAFTLGNSQFRLYIHMNSAKIALQWITQFSTGSEFKGYKLNYNWLYVRPPHTISTSRYNCKPSNNIKDWTLLFIMEVHFIISFYITITLHITMTILTSW